jgi:hypothetical protein
MPISGPKESEGGSERDFLCFTVIGGRGAVSDSGVVEYNYLIVWY